MLRLIFSLVLLAFCVVILVYSGSYTIQARFFPWLVLIPTIAMLLWEISKKAMELFWGKQFKSRASKELQEEEVGRNKIILTSVWLLGFLLAMYLFGLMIGIFIFILMYAKLNGARWHAAIGVPLVVLVFLYGFFTMFMKLDMYPGILGQLVMVWP